MVYGMLENRIKIFASLPIRSLDRLSLQGRLQEIGRMREVAEVSEEA
jgi:arsenate reductase